MEGLQGSQWYLGTLCWLVWTSNFSKELIKSAESFEWFFWNGFEKTFDDFNRKWWQNWLFYRNYSPIKYLCKTANSKPTIHDASKFSNVLPTLTLGTIVYFLHCVLARSCNLTLVLLWDSPGTYFSKQWWSITSYFAGVLSKVLPSLF